MSSIIDTLKKERVNDDTTIDKLIVDLYTGCLKMVKLKNKWGKTDMTYEVPIIHIGYPLYPADIVVLKLNMYLKKKGFKTMYYPPNKIYIKW